MEFQIFHFDSLDSTNLWLKNAAVQGSILPGAVVQADYQSEGRGRLGRKWESQPAQGLLFSLLLNPTLPESHLPLIGLLISLALIDGIADECDRVSTPCRERLELRWPNDILFNGRKLCGILCESAHSLRQCTDTLSSSSTCSKKLVVAGIGLNVNQTEEDFQVAAGRTHSEAFRTPATSIQMITGQRMSPVKLLPSLLKPIGDYLDRLENEGWEWIATEWMKRADLIGKIVDVADGAQRASGIVECILPDGALVLNQDGGVRRIIRTGELSIVFDQHVLAS